MANGRSCTELLLGFDLLIETPNETKHSTA